MVAAIRHQSAPKSNKVVVTRPKRLILYRSPYHVAAPDLEMGMFVSSLSYIGNPV